MDGPPTFGSLEGAGGALTTDLGNGVFETIVDARDGERWIAFDFDTASSPGEDVETMEWDLAFRRFHARQNEMMPVETAIVDGVTIDAFEAESAPTEGFLPDGPDGDDDNDDPDYVISGGQDPWYDYNIMFHTLSPKERVYVVRARDGRRYAMMWVDYYGPTDGESGYPTFRWMDLGDVPR